MHTPISAANIVIRPRTPAANPDDALFDGLRRLMEACGSDKHCRAIAVLSACIGQGINTSSRLRGIARELGFNDQHIRIMLNEGTGRDPARHRWSRDEAGVFSLLY